MTDNKLSTDVSNYLSVELRSMRTLSRHHCLIDCTEFLSGAAEMMNDLERLQLLIDVSYFNGVAGAADDWNRIKSSLDIIKRAYNWEPVEL